MRPACLAFPVLFVVACATSPKMSLEEAFPPASRPAPRKGQRARPEAKALEATRSPELGSALTGFGARARQYRGQTPRGSPMPAAAVDNWVALVEAVDAFLARPAQESSSFDVIRARATLEAELELDARRYGDIPADLAEGLLARIARLATRMAEVRRLQVQTRKLAAALDWPVQPVSVTSLFGRRLHPILKVYRQHLGVDLAAVSGQLVTAAATGTVTRAAWSGGYGYVVEIAHLGDVLTRYSHLAEVLVEAGALVKQGEAVGVAGSTGQSTGVHLHFELWRGGQPVDPLEELGNPPVSPTPMAAHF